MGSLETPPSPCFPVLDPVILNGEMDNPYHDGDLDLLENSGPLASSASAGREFDELFSRTFASHKTTDAYTSSFGPRLRKHASDTNSFNQGSFPLAESSSESPDNSSPRSSSASPGNYLRDASIVSTTTAPMVSEYSSHKWLDTSRKEDRFLELESRMSLDSRFTADADLESSNKVMDSAFDFDGAAGNPLKADTSSLPENNETLTMRVRDLSKTSSELTHTAMPLAAIPPSSDLPFYPENSRQALSGPSVVLSTQGRSGSDEWDGRSPSSLLEEPFGGFSMNGPSPLNSTLSQSLDFGHQALAFGMPEWPSRRVASGKDHVHIPQRNHLKSEIPTRPVLMVHPTSLKSRVETQIPIRLTLFPLPAGAKKLRLPTYTISKPKFLAKPDTQRCPEILELYTSLVCTSAMQDQGKLKRAFARARGERCRGGSSASPATTEESVEDEEKPSEGGEVKICIGCIQRERKRASRKKQRKPDEDELFQKDEEKRVIVFNTNELKDWMEPSKAVPSGYTDPLSFASPGAMQVELPMRIACYCRHQNEKLGFQVILTIKDHLSNVIAQSMTNPIMITDDHKTHTTPAPPVSLSSAFPDGTKLPGTGVFMPGPNVDIPNGPAFGHLRFRSSHSSADLQSLQPQLSSQFPLTPAPFAVSTNANASPSTSLTPRNLSRQTSPSDYQGPSSKRRKHSSSGKLPSGLTMTKLEVSQSSNGSGNASISSTGPQVASKSRLFTSSAERPFVTPSAISGQFGNGPPTPNSSDSNSFFNPIIQHTGFDSLAQPHIASAPSSSHPSRPDSPVGSPRSSFPDQNPSISLGPNAVNQLWPSIANTTNRLPSTIHKLVPAEGSTTGGTEVTLLGSGFCPGMEVVFGDTLATTTTFWGDKCLNCLTPPALQPGLVAVVFKHEHPKFGQLQHQSQPIVPKQQLFFRYVDDRELQMYRLALGILGQKLRNPSDAFQTAQRIMGGDPTTFWNLQSELQGSGGGNQRQVPSLTPQGEQSNLDSRMLSYLEFIDLDDSPRPARYNSQSAAGQTLLHFASSLGLTRFLAGLLVRGANPNLHDNNGHTPMHLAALSGHAHIVNRLRLAGADAHARSIRGFTSADLATSLVAHQAAFLPASHYRSRSVGSSPSLRRRPSSSTSLNSFWETSSASGSLGYAREDSDHSDPDNLDSNAEHNVHEPTYHYTSSRRSSIQDSASSLYYPGSQRDSVQLDSARTSTEANPEADDSRSFSPPAALVAWRNQLATQIHQFQQIVGRAFPNLPALPPMPALPDYQAYPVMRRISNLVPHRPGTSWSAKDGWWDLLTGSSGSANPQPPAYEELYPQKESDEDLDMKKASVVCAATDAALDRHFEMKTAISEASSTQEVMEDIRIGRNSISREQQERLRKQQAQKMKGLRSDRNLYFFWIPVLLLVLCAWLRNLIPGMRRVVSELYEAIIARSTGQTTEVGS